MTVIQQFSQYIKNSIGIGRATGDHEIHFHHFLQGQHFIIQFQQRRMVWELHPAWSLLIAFT